MLYISQKKLYHLNMRLQKIPAIHHRVAAMPNVMYRIQDIVANVLTITLVIHMKAVVQSVQEIQNAHLIVLAFVVNAWILAPAPVAWKQYVQPITICLYALVHLSIPVMLLLSATQLLEMKSA